MGLRENELAKSGEDGFFRAIATNQAEGPVVHDLTVVKPMIRPSVKSGSGESGGAGGFEGGREESGLDVLGVTVGIEAEFGEVNGSVTGEVVKAREVACERFAVFEVNVEGGEVC